MMWALSPLELTVYLVRAPCPKLRGIEPKGHTREKRSGALGGIRTHDLCLRRAALYPLSYKRVFKASAVGIQLA